MRYTCTTCGKWVKDKFFWGTLHLCLLPEEIAQQQEIQRGMIEQKKFAEEIKKENKKIN
jgi:hypothetical protein